ncbi:unnamed protein product [Cylicocyclus nassatus]|uniref:Uncharacterized protein n=1 Tax=Cylicocyclus nassatus TaxID=53992 RepID=A0AA36GH62_CYLNA|nr:unnamed protein product [Cylicocyclus nassatus]
MLAEVMSTRDLPVSQSESSMLLLSTLLICLVGKVSPQVYNYGYGYVPPMSPQGLYGYGPPMSPQGPYGYVPPMSPQGPYGYDPVVRTYQAIDAIQEGTRLAGNVVEGVANIIGGVVSAKVQDVAMFGPSTSQPNVNQQ